MQKYLDYVTDIQGNVIPSATVRVKRAGTATDATLYSDNGVTPLVNPFEVESTDGSYYFYAANGRYDLITAATGYLFDADDTADLRVFDPSDLIASGSTAARSLEDRFADILNVKDFGAVGNGVTDDTGAFAAAIAALIAAGGGLLWIPASTYKVVSALTIASPIWIAGAGRNSIISTTSASADIFTITATASNPGVEIERLTLQCSTTRSSGQYINSSGANGTKVRRCRINAGYVGIAATGAAAEGFVVEGCVIVGQTSVGVNVTAATGAQGMTSSYIQNNLISGASVGAQTPIAIQVGCAGDLTIRENSTLYCSASITAVPTTGQTVQAIRIHDNWLDSGTANGIAISPTGGTVRLATIVNNWIASFTLDGMVASGTGTIQKLDVRGNAIGTNGSNGINLASNIISESVMSENTIGGAGSSGINIVANLNKFRILNNTIGVTGQFTQNGAWDILINAGTSTTYQVANNTLTGGVSGGLSDGGTGTAGLVRDNLGYNPVGVTGPTTVGASPATITAGHAPETHYYLQAATNTATVKLSGTVVGTMSSATIPVVVHLEPNESTVITWATTAPTYVKSVH